MLKCELLSTHKGHVAVVQGEKNGRDLSLSFPITAKLKVEKAAYPDDFHYLVVERISHPRLTSGVLNDGYGYEIPKRGSYVTSHKVFDNKPFTQKLALTGFDLTTTFSDKRDTWALNVSANDFVIENEPRQKPKVTIKANRQFRFYGVFEEERELVVQELIKGSWVDVVDYQELNQVFNLISTIYVVIKKMYQKKVRFGDIVRNLVFGYLEAYLKYGISYFRNRDILAFLYYCRKNKHIYHELGISDTKAHNLMLPCSVLNSYEDDFDPLSRFKDSEYVQDIATIKEQVDYWLSQGETKKARQSFLYGISFVPSLQKRIISLTTILRRSDVQLLARIVEKHGSDNIVYLWDCVLDIINYHGIDKKVRYFSFNKESTAVIIMRFMLLIDYGFSFKHIRQFLADQNVAGLHYVKDTLEMFELVKTHIPDIEIRHANIKQWHDYLVRQNNEYQTLTYNLTRNVDLSSLDKPFTKSLFDIKVIGGYTFKPVAKIIDLMSIGVNLNICVGWAGYMQRMSQGEIEVLPVYLGNKLVACLEIVIGKGLTLVQAKLAFNKPVKNNTLLLTSLIQWVETYKIAIAYHCTDVF